MPMAARVWGFDLIGLLPFTPLFTDGLSDICIKIVQRTAQYIV